MADRNYYLDNQRAAQIDETISKEKRIQRSYFEREAAAGRLPAWSPPPPSPHPSLLERVGLPAFASSFSPDVNAELATATTLSKHMWTSNPGYVLRDGRSMQGSTHRQYAWEEDAIAFMKAQGCFDTRHHKRRDEFSQYVEAAARAHHQLGSRPPALAGKGTGAAATK